MERVGPPERVSSRFSHVRRWTQGPQPAVLDAQDELEERPLLHRRADGEGGAEPLDRKPPWLGVRDVFTLGSTSKQLLADRDATLAVGCAGLIMFVHGTQGMQQLAVNYFLKEDLGVSPAVLSSVVSVTWLAGVAKPLFGFASDALPIYGYRRKPYLALSGLVGFLSWMCMATLVDRVWSALICIAVPAFAMACANVLAQALVVERSRGESQEFAGRLQTCIWGSREAGAILSSFVGGWLLSFVSAKQVFLIAALLPLALVLVAVVVQEEQDARESASWTDVRENLIKAGRAFQHPQIWKPCAFLFFLHATPYVGSTFFFWYTDVARFSPSFLGTMQVVGSVFSLLGVLFFDSALRSMRFVDIIVWGTVLCSALGCSQIVMILRWNLKLGIPDEVHSSSRASLLLANLLAHTLPVPRAH